MAGHAQRWVDPGTSPGELSQTHERDADAVMLRDAERDIDALLVEDLLFAPVVGEWLIGRLLGRDVAVEGVEAEAIRRPAREDNGLDIAVAVTAGGQPLTVRIANRLLPRPRLARAVGSGGEGRSPVMLLRPECTASRCAEIDPHFDAVMTHDDYAQLLSARAATEGGEIGRRLLHRAGKIGQAIEAAAKAIQSAPLSTVEDFLRGYLAMLPAIDADLVPHPDMLDARRPMMVFSPKALPKWPFLPQMRLAHHLHEGVVSLSFGGWGAFFNEMVQVMEPALTRTPFQVALSSAGLLTPSLLIIEETAPLSLDRAPEDQETAIRTAALAADRLRRWLAGQRTAARYWAEIAGEERGEERQSRVRHDVTLG